MQFQTTHQAMGTVMAHKAFGGEAQLCLAAICEEIDTLEMLMSRFIPDSEISRINASSGLGEPEPVSQPVLDVLMLAAEISQRCHGYFDVTAGSLVDLWTWSKQTGVQPDPADIDMVLPLINYQDLILDPYELTAYLKYSGQAIDLGGIGKGFAGDVITGLYREFGINSAFSNLGGNVVAVGVKPDGSPWSVGIQHPRRPQDLIGSVTVENQTVVTSGDYQRAYLASPDCKYHHILNLRTGYPSESDLISVTIVAKQGMVADALSTALFVAGLEHVTEILTDFPGVDAVLINRELQVFVTDGLKTCFHPQKNVKINEF